MEQPASPSAIPQTSSSNNKPIKKKAPTPQALISHYQSQGLDSQEASIKVIEDLQNVLFRVISANSKNNKDKFIAETSRKIDVLNTRVALLDMKMDSKPGYVEGFAIGIASGAALRGLEAVWPHVLGGIGHIWSAVRNATEPSSSSSP